MKIWIDADSCPVQARTLICKAGIRLSVQVIFVANRPIPYPESPLFKMLVEKDHPDAADDRIVLEATESDLVITRDIPLAKRLVDRKIRVINDRGTVYTEKNINERLSMRNLMLDLYQSGIVPDKTGTYGKKEIQEFANALDRELTRMTRSQKG